MEYYLAADSGGSKTVWKLLDASGRIAAAVQTEGLGAVNPGILPVRETIMRAKSELIRFAFPARIFLSLGGPNAEEVTEALKACWPDIPVAVEREACGKSILAAVIFLGCNAAVLCGTGSTAVGNVSGIVRFCGGWGPIYGDGGSGGGIGSDALKLFLRSLDGLADAGRVPEVFLPLSCGVDVSAFEGRMEVKRRALSMSRREIASLAAEIWELAESGDAASMALYEKAADEIAAMADAVTESRQGSAVLVCGGLFSGKPKFLALCRKKFSDRNCAQMRYDPAFSPIVSAEMAVLRETGIAITEKIVKNILEGTTV